ncbi:MAG: AAA family ATPase [Allomuricauda sp.]|jgi:energy-coupling factor transporter ATP-binding protein EcfA2
MRITEIEINNFRAFYGKHTISLDKDGKNLMVYGENGSGKSSFYLALKTFFESAVKPVDLQALENIFIPKKDKDTASLKFVVKQNDKASSSTSIEINVPHNEITGSEKLLIADANKIKGFFDYKSLLKTHLVETKKVNLFDLLITNILSEQENRFTTKQIGKEWEAIIYDSHELRQGVHVRNRLKTNIDNFNLGVADKLKEIEKDTNTFIQTFGYNINIKLNYLGISYHGRRDIKDRTIDVEIDFFKKTITQHQHFLNEARLSALAISLYLATVKSNPSKGVLKALVLDDLLIGLDMSNRLPLLDIIKNHFQDDFQIIMTTYDKIWFELVKNFFGDSKWKYIDIFSKKLKSDDFEIPIIKQNTDYIEKAEFYLKEKDYKASAVYVRSEFEKLVNTYCDKNNLLVKYKVNTKELKSDDFWKAIKTQTNIDASLIKEVEMCRGTVMNPFSHHDLTKPVFEAELKKSIDVVKKLKTPPFRKDSNKTHEKLSLKIKELESKITQRDTTINQIRKKIPKTT